jgi:hypothetical protein
MKTENSKLLIPPGIGRAFRDVKREQATREKTQKFRVFRLISRVACSLLASFN